MAKKRKCRYTAEELAIHEEAVRLRKMTDRQLVEEFHRAAEQEVAVRKPQEAQKNTKEDSLGNDTPDIQKLLNALSEGRVKGIKNGIAYKVAQLAEEMGLI